MRLSVSLAPALFVVAVQVGAVGCGGGSYPPKPPPPPVEPAPAEVAALAIHVHRLVTPPETEADRWDYEHMSGLTRGLREAFQLALTRAGYRVVIGRHDPRDLVATIRADFPRDRPGVATLSLAADGRVVEQLSVEIPMVGDPPRTVHLEEHAAAMLVHGMSASPALRALAERFGAQEPLRMGAPPATGMPRLAPGGPPGSSEMAGDGGVDAAQGDEVRPD